MARNFLLLMMEASGSAELTRLLRAWSDGDAAALDRLVPKVYTELRRLARRYMKNEAPGNTLQTTALVNEVYLRLVDVTHTDWKDRAHFFAMSAKMMRRVDTERDKAPGRYVYLQSQEAMKTAREHGFENVTERVAAGRPHGPLAEEVLEYFAGLAR